MFEKIKCHSDKISLVLSIVSIALFMPTFFSYVGATFTDHNVIHLIRYILLLISNAVIVVEIFVNKKMSKNAVMLGLLALMSAFLVTNIYSLINNEFSAIPYICLYVGIIVLYFISSSNEKVEKIFYLLLIIALAFSVASVFGASTVALATLLTSLVIFGNIYFINKGEK